MGPPVPITARVHMTPQGPFPFSQPVSRAQVDAVCARDGNPEASGGDAHGGEKRSPAHAWHPALVTSQRF
eukprot:5239529-Pyramimonas_sp.AAC.3